MKSDIYDLIIIGAGPAGMAAAATAAQKKLRVAILDEQQTPGGQIYRSIKQPAPADEHILGPDYYYGRHLLEGLENAPVTYLPGTMVWSIDDDLNIAFSHNGSSQKLKAKRVLLATGAMERPAPFVGWTTPGVMTCGSAQILMKTSGLTPALPLVLAGSGPLLLLIAVQLLRADVPISAILDTTPKGRYRSALRYLPNALKNTPLLLKGVGLLFTLKKAGIRYINHVTDLTAIEGSNHHIERVKFSSPKGQESLACTTLLVHQGVVPNTQLSRALQLKHQWDELQQCWRPERDRWGETSKRGIFIAGDGGGIAGAKAAEYQGQLSALKIATQLNASSTDSLQKEANDIEKRLQQQLSVRPFLDHLYQPASPFLLPPDETIVCRCEEVTAGEIRNIAKLGCSGPNQTKSFCRSGMGPCQGRLCGLTVANIIADVHQTSMDEVGYYRIRTPIKPLTIGELADLAE
jgi:thioredoxin reductase/bacterioferritin-associated ferredoxin